MSNTTIVSLVSNELTKSRQQSAQDLAEYMRETRTAIADVHHPLRTLQDWMEMQPVQEKS